MFSSVATHDFASTFSIGDKLGEGAFATVFRAIPLRADQMPSGEHMAPCYAVKRIKREGLEDIDEQSVLDEVRTGVEARGGMHGQLPRLTCSF